jgi:hypothetical protein
MGQRGASRAKVGGGGQEGPEHHHHLPFSPTFPTLAPSPPCPIYSGKYTINIEKYLSLVFLSTRFPEELHMEGDNPTQYTGKLLGSESRRSTSATSLDRSGSVVEHHTCEKLWGGSTYVTQRRARGLLVDPEVGDKYDNIIHVLAER